MPVPESMRFLARRFWLIVLVALVTVTVAAQVTRRQPPVYSATAVVRFALMVDPSRGWPGPDYTDQVLGAATYLVESPPFLQAALVRLPSGGEPDDLALAVAAQPVPGAPLLQVTVESRSAAAAQAVANGLASLMAERADEAYPTSSEGFIAALSKYLDTVEAQLEEDRATLQVLQNQQDDLWVTRIQDISSKIAAEEAAYARLLQTQVAATETQLRLAHSASVAVYAPLPLAPARPRLALNLALAALVGLLGGLILAVIVDRADTKIHSTEDLSLMTGAEVIGALPRIGVSWWHRWFPAFIGRPNHSSASTALEWLASMIDCHAAPRPRSLLVASAEAKAGKSAVVGNLALTLARAGRRVVVVDCNLRRPSLDTVLGVRSEIGLSSMAQWPAAPGDPAWLQGALVHSVPGLAVLTAGPKLRYPERLLSSHQMKDLLGHLVASYDYVILDSPALDEVPDALALAAIADGTLLVAVRGASDAMHLQRAAYLVRRAGGTVFGSLLNAARQGDLARCGQSTGRELGSAAGGSSGSTPAADPATPSSQREGAPQSD